MSEIVVVTEETTSVVEVVTQGPQGPQGFTGPTGPTGPQGPAGVTSSVFDYFLSSSNTPPPGDDYIATNETVLADSTSVYLSYSPNGQAGSVRPLIASMLQGDTLIIQDKFDDTLFVEYEATADAIDFPMDGYAEVPVVFVSEGATPLVKSDQNILLFVSRVGPVGPQGPQGPQGIQGEQGEQGEQGLQGVQGIPGTDGADGAQGAPGADGADGADGSSSSVFNYALAAATTPPPLSGEIRTNGSGAGATQAYISYFVSSGAAMAPLLRLIKVGDFLTAQEEADATKWIQFTVSGTPVDFPGSSYIQIPITYLAGPGTDAKTGQSILVFHTSVGATGPQGATGPAGPTGATGATGPQGPQGIQGVQGPQGIQGATGATGSAGSVWRGVWNSATAYVTNDVVRYVGTNSTASSYIALQNNTNQAPAEGGDTAYWGLYVQEGAPGPQGIQGPQGPQGIQGIQGPAGPSGASVEPAFPPYIAGRYYDQRIIVATPANLVAGFGSIYYSPQYFHRAVTFDEVAIFVTTAASATARIGMYNQANGVPTTLVADWGTVSIASTTGAKAIGGLNVFIPQPGWYFMAILLAGSGSPQLGAIPAASQPAWLGSLSAFAAAQGTGYSETNTILPATATPSATLRTTTPPLVAFKPI